MKEGEKRRDLKCLQVDLRLKNVFNGRNERTRSRMSSGNLLHISGSISCSIRFLTQPSSCFIRVCESISFSRLSYFPCSSLTSISMDCRWLEVYEKHVAIPYPRCMHTRPIHTATGVPIFSGPVPVGFFFLFFFSRPPLKKIINVYIGFQTFYFLLFWVVSSFVVV